MTLTIAKKTANKAVNGRASWKASPNLCSSVIPLNEVKRIITASPTTPTAAK